MGLFFQDTLVKVVFKDEIINEDYFKAISSNIKIAILIRDYRFGRAGGSIKHKYSPSIKISDYGHGKSNNHTKDGDPVYFFLDESDNLFIKFENEKSFGKKEKKYVENFIRHNYLNLKNYWYAPDYIKDPNRLFQYQTKIEERIRSNVINYNYNQYQGEVDDEIEY